MKQKLIEAARHLQDGLITPEEFYRDVTLILLNSPVKMDDDTLHWLAGKIVDMEEVT